MRRTADSMPTYFVFEPLTVFEALNLALNHLVSFLELSELGFFFLYRLAHISELWTVREKGCVRLDSS